MVEKSVCKQMNLSSIQNHQFPVITTRATGMGRLNHCAGPLLLYMFKRKKANSHYQEFLYLPGKEI